MSRESMMEDAKRKTYEMLRTWDREDVLKFVAKTFLSVTIHGNNSRNLFLATIEYVPKSTLIERFLTQDDKPYGGKDSLKRNIDSLCYWVYETGDSSLLSALLLYKHYNTNYRDVITELVYTMEVDGIIAKRGEPVQYNSMCGDYHSIVFLCEDWVEGATGTLAVSSYSNLMIKGQDLVPVELLRPVTITQN